MTDTNSLAHTKWNCKYHIVFAPKYRRKIFYGEKRAEIGKILRELCEWKQVTIVEAEVCADHIHKLDEVFEVSEYVNIMRNGKNVVEGLTEEFDKTKMTYYMTGKDLKDKTFDAQVDKTEVILETRGLGRGEEFRDTSFQLYKGELLGITGLLGSGRTPLAETMFGITSKSSGEIYLYGQRLRIRNAGDAVKAGIGYVPEDRLTKGLFLSIPIFRNIAATILTRYSNRFSSSERNCRGGKQEVRGSSNKGSVA